MRYLIFIFCCSCSFIDEPIYDVDQQLEPYLLQAYEESLKRGQDYRSADVMVYFDDYNDRLGSSHRRSDGVKRISISKSNWELLTDTQKSVTFFHEFGHAFLFREHNQGCGSIMSPANKYPCKYKNFTENRSEMLDELFFSGY